MRIFRKACRKAGLSLALSGAITLAAAALTFNPASAQNVTEAQRQALETAFQDLLTDPTNLDKTYAYAELAKNSGDYEAAITSYERLLLFNPNLPRVRAELGVLYFRLQSFDTARSYFEAVLAEEDAPEIVKQRVQTFLNKIDDARNPHSFSGSATIAGRFQTNANYGPDGDILVGGAPATPGDETVADEDFNIFAVLSGRYTYDVGNDAGDFFAVEGTIYGSRQLKFTNLDVEHIRLIVGPGFRYFPTDSGPVTVRPTIRSTYVRLDDETYNFAIGVGLDVDWQAFDDTSIFVRSFLEDREYYNTTESPNAESQDGGAVQMTLGARYIIDQNTGLRGQITASKVHASEGFESYKSLGGALALSKRFDSPFKDSKSLSFLGQAWNGSLNVQYTRRLREEANPIVSPEKRKDHDLRLSGTVAIPVGNAISVFTTLGWQDQNSNLPNNTFDNFSATLGVNMRF